MNKKHLITLGCLVLTINIAKASDIENDPMASLFSKVENAEDLDIEGQACHDFILKKGWIEGFNVKNDGSEFFVSVGVSNVKAPWQSSNFVSSMMNASIGAHLNSKSEMAQALSKKISSNIISNIEQNFSEGKEPLALTAELTDKTRQYDELSVIEKAKVLFVQELDKLVDDDSKNKVNENGKAAQKEVEKINGIINSSKFQDNITAKSNSTIRGLKNAFTHIDTLSGNGQSSVCSVGIWSQKLAKRVDAMTTGQLELLKNQKPGKPLITYIPDEKTFEGYKKLLTTFGTFTVRNELGEVSVLSFAQEGIKGRNGEQIAFSVAQLKAERAIIQLRKENIDVVQASSNLEISNEYNDGLVEYYTESNHQARVSAAASGQLSGSRVIKRWKGLHVNDKPFAGVVVSWSPSQQEMSANAQLLNGESAIGQTALDANTARTLIGNAIGDDDEDF